jgi:hypothetical protein
MTPDIDVRRVATCLINDCCPYRTNLCAVARGCHGSLTGRPVSGGDQDVFAGMLEADTVFIVDDEAILRRDGALTRYGMGPAIRQMFVDYDRGSPLNAKRRFSLTIPPRHEGRAARAARRWS